MGYTNCDHVHIDAYMYQIGRWSTMNFGSVDTGPTGLVEEVAELYEAMGGDDEVTNRARTLFGPVAKMCRAWVKRTQGIRGTHEQWSAEMRMEAADVFIKLAQICYDEHFSLEDAVAERWAVVGARDFVSNPIGHGMPKEAER